MGLANNNIKRYPEYAHACKKDDTITSSEENLYELFPSHHCPDILHIPSTDILIKITRVKKHFALMHRDVCFCVRSNARRVLCVCMRERKRFAREAPKASFIRTMNFALDTSQLLICGLHLYFESTLQKRQEKSVILDTFH